MKNRTLLARHFIAIAAAFTAVTVAAAAPHQVFAEDSTESEAMYRLYNPNSGEHFYTASAAEKDHLVSVGWHDEGVGWYAPVSSETPVYRLYNANAGDHHYTISADERDHLVSVGWRDEGIGWYSSDAQTIPLYRQYNPNAISGAHNFTKSKDENDYLVSVGWRNEGISWYGVRHWVDEQGHWENTTEQVWVPDVVTVVDTPATTKQVYDHTEYIFYYDGYTTTDNADCKAHMIALIKAGHLSNYSIKDIYTTQTVPAVTHTEDHGHYETKVTGKKWVVDVAGHWED